MYSFCCAAKCLHTAHQCSSTQRCNDGTHGLIPMVLPCIDVCSMVGMLPLYGPAADAWQPCMQEWAFDGAAPASTSNALIKIYKFCMVTHVAVVNWSCMTGQHAAIMGVRCALCAVSVSRSSAALPCTIRQTFPQTKCIHCRIDCGLFCAC
jgi:hypothetical protein